MAGVLDNLANKHRSLVLYVGLNSCLKEFLYRNFVRVRTDDLSLQIQFLFHPPKIYQDEKLHQIPSSQLRKYATKYLS